MAVWKARIGSELDPDIGALLASVDADITLVPYDVMGSIAHAIMLGKCGIVPQKDSEALVAGLRKVWASLDTGQAHLDPSLEDVHMNIEALLEKAVGADTAGHLHAGRSRNDQVALDIKLYIREATEQTYAAILELQKVLLHKAIEQQDTIVPGHTHLQQAQPILLGHIFMAHFQQAQRDLDRLQGTYERANVSPLGAGALAGTTLPIDPAITASLLGFDHVFANSLDAVSDRDAAVELVFDLSLAMVHISGLCEEAVLWSSAEFGWMTPGPGTCTGSSMMPQKRNPDVFEIVRGKSGHVTGDLMSLLTTLKGLPLAYNRDLQETKTPMFDAVETAVSSFSAVGKALMAAEFHPPPPKPGNGILATDMAEALVKSGTPFRKAHAEVGKMVLDCEKSGKAIPGNAVGDIWSSVNNRASWGGTAPAQLEAAIEHAHAQISSNEATVSSMKEGCMKARALLLKGP